MNTKLLDAMLHSYSANVYTRDKEKIFLKKFIATSFSGYCRSLKEEIYLQLRLHVVTISWLHLAIIKKQQVVANLSR